jgi:hypothetical protein
VALAGALMAFALLPAHPALAGGDDALGLPAVGAPRAAQAPS